MSKEITQWMNEVKTLLISDGIISKNGTISQNSWQMYFDDGLTPAQAILDDLELYEDARKFHGGFLMESK